MKPVKRPWGILLVCLISLAAISACATPLQEPTSSARLIVLDVGEGQAILLTRGSHGLLIDTGRTGMGRRVLERMRHYGVRTLDTVVYTHLHPDHAGSWFRIHEAFPRVRVIENGQRLRGANWPDVSRWVANALDRLTADQHRIVRTGDHWRWRGIAFKVLWPGNVRGGGLNYRSLVLELRYQGSRVLVMGDAGSRVEDQLLAAGTLPSDIGVLVAGHHGSKNTSSAPFLERLQPAYSVVSTNRDNIRGYPARATIKRLRRYSGTLLRTWVDGDGCFLLGKTGASAC